MHFGRRVLTANEELHAVPLGDLAHQLAEVAATFERGEDVAEPGAVGELWRLHHVEEAVAKDLLDRGGVSLAQLLGESLHHAARDGAQWGGFGERACTRLNLVRRAADQTCVQPASDTRELILINALRERKKRGADAAVTHHRNKGGEAIGATHQVNVAETGGGRAHRRGEPSDAS